MITILESVRDQLPADSKSGIERELLAIRNEAKDESVDGGAESPTGSHPDDSVSERYLGEASDIVFYNSVKQSLNLQSPASGAGAPASTDTPEASYEQLKPNQRTQHELSSVMPSRATTNRYLDIYFTTIHIAYPFLPQSQFEEAHNEWWQSGSQSKFSSADTWLALMRMLSTTAIWLMLTLQCRSTRLDRATNASLEWMKKIRKALHFIRSSSTRPWLYCIEESLRDIWTTCLRS